MAWGEMSQTDFLKYVVPNELISDDQLLKASIAIMTAAVQNPGANEEVSLSKIAGLSLKWVAILIK
jgi:hypothetical protein